MLLRDGSWQGRSFAAPVKKLLQRGFSDDELLSDADIADLLPLQSLIYGVTADW